MTETKTYEIETTTEAFIYVGADHMEIDGDGDVLVELTSTEMRRVARMLLAQADAAEGIDLES